MQGQQPDPIALAKKLAQIHEWEQRNVEPYDKAILTLSSGALALSLTFIKDLVPPEIAQVNWVLYLTWTLFVLSLATNIIGFIYTLLSFPRQRQFAEDVFKHCSKTEPQFNDYLKSLNRVIDAFNIFQGVFFLAGMVAFTAYVVVNFELHSRALHAPKQPAAIAANPAAPPALPQGSPPVNKEKP